MLHDTGRACCHLLAEEARSVTAANDDTAYPSTSTLWLAALLCRNLVVTHK